MNRRNLLQIIGKAIAGLFLFSGTMLQVGCNVFDDILNWVPIGQAAVSSILAVLTGNGILVSPGLAEIIKLVDAGFANLIAAVKEYKSITPPPVGALSKIEAAFKSVIDNFQAFLQSLSVSGGLLAIIAGLAQIIFSTIAAFMNRLPASSSLHRTVIISNTVRVGPGSFPVIPKERGKS